MSEKLLEINNLHVVYRTENEIVHAVNGLNLVLNKGETLGIVGETGAGKTTTALSIMRLLPKETGDITEGDIIFENIEISKAKESEMRKIRGEKISMIFQDPMTSLNPVITVGDQIAETLKLHRKMSKKDIYEAVDDLLELVGISPSRKKDYPHQFSGGMKQRVIIAIALACQPELLIADEPTTALDVTIQAQVLEMMADIKQKLNTAMIMISHDLGVISETCDNVAVMYAGEIIESGTLEDIFTGQNHHPYTIGLFNSIPRLNEESKRLMPIEGLMPNPAKLPNGCKFHPRCKECMDICKQKHPGESKSGTHSIRCHLFK